MFDFSARDVVEKTINCAEIRSHYLFELNGLKVLFTLLGTQLKKLKRLFLGGKLGAYGILASK